MRILLATNHLFQWTGSEITLQLIAKILESYGHETLVFSPFHSTAAFVNKLLDGIHYTSSLDEVSQFEPDIAYTQHHTSALLVRSACPFVKILHGVLGVLPHLEQPPILDLGITKFLALSEEVAESILSKGKNDSEVIIFRNIVDDYVFKSNDDISELHNIICYSYKINDYKFSALEKISRKLGVGLVDHRKQPGAIPYKDIPFLLQNGEIVVASGRCAIEAMLCGKVPLILSDCGDDGLVTPDNFQDLMRFNFSGRMSGGHFDEVRIEKEISLYKPQYGQQLQTMAKQHFGRSERESEVNNIFEGFYILADESSSEIDLEAIRFNAQVYKDITSWTLNQYKNNLPENCDGSLPTDLVQIQMFWRAKWTEQHDGYSESCSVADTYKLDGSHQVIRLLFPEDTGIVSRLRLDVLNAIGVVDICNLKLLDSTGAVAWDWSGDLSLMQRKTQLIFVPGFSSEILCSIVSFGDDPWFEIDLPQTVISNIQQGFSIEIEMIPYRFMDRLPFVMQSILQRDLSFSVGAPRVISGSVTSLNLPGLICELEVTKGLVKTALDHRDKIISHQSQQIFNLQQEIIRAEAQLDLLKDLMLDPRMDDRF